MTADRIPAVSVLMTSRNAARFLGASLDCLVAQSFSDFEIVLVDGSSDETPRLIEDWQKREPRLRAFRVPGPRLARVHNFGAAQARAPLLARLDADDLADPDWLAIHVRTLAAQPTLCALGSSGLIIDADGRTLGTLEPPLSPAALRAALDVGCTMTHSGSTVRAAAFHAAGGYRPGLNIAEDYDLWCRLAEHGDIANLPAPLVRYRVHRTSLSSRKPARMALATLCVRAARQARRNGAAEPFLGGAPDLRRAAALLDLTHERAKASVRLTAWRVAVSRSWFTAPLVPASLRAGLRRLALRLRLRPVLVGIGRLVTGAPASAEAPLREVRG